MEKKNYRIAFGHSEKSISLWCVLEEPEYSVFTDGRAFYASISDGTDRVEKIRATTKEDALEETVRKLEVYRG